MNRTLLILAFVLGVASTPGQAQGRDVDGDERAGTAAASYLLVPTTARTASLGNGLTGGLSTLSGVEALQTNPAALTSNTGTQALFSYTGYVADIGVNFFGVAQNFGASNVALTVTSWDFGDIARTTAVNSDPTSLTFQASTVVVGASYARRFTDRISAGVTAKGIAETIDDINGSAIAFDAGMTYNVGDSGLQFGVALRNFGTKMSYSGTGLTRSETLGGSPGPFPLVIATEQFELPSLLSFGASYTRSFEGNLTATALGNFRSNAYDQAEFAGGLELGYDNLVYARFGANLMPVMSQNNFEFWNVGAGINLPISNSGIAVDYAYRQTEAFGGVNMITASIGF